MECIIYVALAIAVDLRPAPFGHIDSNMGTERARH